MGIVGLLEDRFIDMSADERPPEQKLYLNTEKELIFPSENLLSFLYGQNESCAKRFEQKKWKDYAKGGMAYTSIVPEFPTINRNGRPIHFNGFVGPGKDYDDAAFIRVVRHKAMIKKGSVIVPSPKIRPMVEPPWEIEFEITIFENSLITIQKIKNWLLKGGTEIGFGTYRPRFGRFGVEFTD
jgi:hypothetical protein